MKEYRIVTQTQRGIVVIETVTDVLAGDVGFTAHDNLAYVMNRFNSPKYDTYPPGSVWVEQRDVGPWRRMEAQRERQPDGQL